MFQRTEADDQLTSATVSRSDEQDDYERAELDRMKKAGFPIDASPAEQLAFLESMDDLPFG